MAITSMHGTYNLMLRRHCLVACKNLNVSVSRFYSAASPRSLVAEAAGPDVTSLVGLFDVEYCPEEALFPQLTQSSMSATLIGIDPDVNGALALLRWNNPHPNKAFQLRATKLEQDTSIEFIDMPIETLKLGNRDKKQINPVVLSEVLHRIATEGSPNSSNTVLAAALEHTTPQHLSGKHAWYGIGFSTGMLSGLLTAHDIPYQRVNAAVWKRQMGLFRLGKEGSLALAHQLFPAAAAVSLKRKKDHGRAEALLIAAWALGIRASLDSKTDSSQEEDTENDSGS